MVVDPPVPASLHLSLHEEVKNINIEIASNVIVKVMIFFFIVCVLKV